MELEWERKQALERMDEVISFQGKITMREIERLTLDSFDRLLLDECGSSNKAEDWLLALEMLFRRQREQTSNVEFSSGVTDNGKSTAGSPSAATEG